MVLLFISMEKPLLAAPFFVVIISTPPIALEPYKDEAVGPFKRSILSISSVGTSLKLIFS
ncbi:hypothetical protein D3C87_1272530 [compost metagenome]